MGGETTVLVQSKHPGRGATMGRLQEKAGWGVSWDHSQLFKDLIVWKNNASGYKDAEIASQ